MARVLIVDDAAFMRMMLKSILEQGGYEIVGEAATGTEAVAKHNFYRPDLIMMDITMPDMEGIDAVKEIRTKDVEVPIIMCTAMGNKFTVVEAMRAGATDFVVKPFQADRLLEAAGKALARLGRKPTRAAQ